MVTPVARRAALELFRDRRRLSERKACRLSGYSRSCHIDAQVAGNRQLNRFGRGSRSWARECPRFGYRRLHVLLRREGWQINRKRVYRILPPAESGGPAQARNAAVLGQRRSYGVTGQVVLPEDPAPPLTSSFERSRVRESRTPRICKGEAEWPSCSTITIPDSYSGSRSTECSFHCTKWCEPPRSLCSTCLLPRDRRIARCWMSQEAPRIAAFRLR